jgi:type IV secretory pathway VirB10-like protein
LIGSLAAAALMLIGAFAYVVIGSGKRTAEHAAAPKTAPAAKAPAPAAVQPPPVAVALAPPPAAPAPTPTPEIAAGQVQPATTEPVGAAAPSRGTAADTSQRPGKPAADTAREKQRAERARQREAAAAAKRAAAQAAPAAKPELVTSADQPPEPKPLSRWERMAQENSACEAEGFFGRLACKEKLRWKYCPGYWGKVAQCPEGQSQGGGN